jgi:hypothetical protein
LKISTIASRESWQFANDTVLWKTIWQRLREKELFAKLVKSDVIADVESAGIELSEGQELNILTILVTFTVLNNGTDCSELQLTNIVDILVTLEVSNNGID